MTEPRSVLAQVQSILRIYTRAFLSQSVGFVGLLWCLFDGHTVLGVVLALLVLADQAFFLFGRFSWVDGSVAAHRAIDVWCLCVGLFDVILLFAMLFCDGGLHDPLAGAGTGHALDAVAFSTATLFHLGSDLQPANPLARLLAAIEALIGAVVVVAFGVTLVLALYTPRASEPPPVD